LQKKARQLVPNLIPRCLQLLLVAALKYVPAGALIGKYLLELERKSGVTVLGVK